MKAKQKGFTMVELLVVLVIVGILAAVATPLYLANTRRARASEAVATMGLIRQGLRDYNVAHNQYFNITNITAAPPAGVAVDVGVAQYFSNAAFRVTTDTSSWGASNVTNSTPVDFVITANGTTTGAPCGSTPSNCAQKATEVNTTDSQYVLKMDNSGNIFVSYDNGVTWSAW